MKWLLMMIFLLLWNMECLRLQEWYTRLLVCRYWHLFFVVEFVENNQFHLFNSHAGLWVMTSTFGLDSFCCTCSLSFPRCWHAFIYYTRGLHCGPSGRSGFLLCKWREGYGNWDFLRTLLTLGILCLGRGEQNSVQIDFTLAFAWVGYDG